MAIIVFGPTVIGARGTVGGGIFSANKSGPFLRAWSKGGNPRSPRQTDNRNNLTTFAVAWANLTQAERDDWDDYADDPAQEFTNSLGIDYFASGFNWFIKINMAKAQAGEAQRDDAPTDVRNAAPTIVNFAFRSTASASNTRWDVQAADPNVGDLHLTRINVFGSEGRNTTSLKYVFMKIALLDGLDQISFQTEIEEAFGTITHGMTCFTTIQSQDGQGQRSPVTTATALATT